MNISYVIDVLQDIFNDYGDISMEEAVKIINIRMGKAPNA